jgi:hypothetical protein
MELIWLLYLPPLTAANAIGRTLSSRPTALIEAGLFPSPASQRAGHGVADNVTCPARNSPAEASLVGHGLGSRGW